MQVVLEPYTVPIFLPVYTVYIRLAGFGDTRDTWSFISKPCSPRTKDMTDVGLRPDCEYELNLAEQ